MGTETSCEPFCVWCFDSEEVKKNNPLMGTETDCDEIHEVDERNYLLKKIIP